jgi:hypothetical protein
METKRVVCVRLWCIVLPCVGRAFSDVRAITSESVLQDGGNATRWLSIEMVA